MIEGVCFGYHIYLKRQAKRPPEHDQQNQHDQGQNKGNRKKPEKLKEQASK